MTSLPNRKDKALFTPGPLTTSDTVKRAMLHDLGSRDTDFIQCVGEIRRKLVALCSNTDQYTAVLMQGSGTFGIEAVISSVISPRGRLLVIVNGAYGRRILKMANIHQIPAVKLASAEDSFPTPAALDAILGEEPGITHVAAVHCETTTGIINPIEAYGEVVRQHNRTFIVDAMSSFGAYPIEMETVGVDYLISSSNKCIEGIPGFSIVIARKAALLATRGCAKTLSLDLLDQWESLERDGQFRFTPPTHAILAFQQALRELESEGGVEGRARRYRENYAYTIFAMQSIGFKPYLDEAKRGHIITSFYYPEHPNFNFQEFYSRLSEKGHIIYPGKLSLAECFRIGHIGRLDSSDVRRLITAVRETLDEMNVELGEGAKV